MWGKFKWDMFVTSFIPLWLSIIVSDVWDFALIVWDEWIPTKNLLNNFIIIAKSGCIQLISVFTIIIVVGLSFYGINSFLRKTNASKDLSRGTIIKATKANKLSSEFLLAYILPMIAFDFGDVKQIVLFLIYFAVLSYLCIRNNNIYTNILLEFKGYRMYHCDLQCNVLEKKHTYYDSIIISKINLTQEQENLKEHVFLAKGIQLQLVFVFFQC